MCQGRSFCKAKDLDELQSAGSMDCSVGKTKEPSALRRDAHVWGRQEGTEFVDTRPCCACTSRASHAGVTSEKIEERLEIDALIEAEKSAEETLSASGEPHRPSLFLQAIVI